MIKDDKGLKKMIKDDKGFKKDDKR